MLMLVPAGTANGQPPRKYTNVERLALARLAAVTGRNTITYAISDGLRLMRGAHIRSSRSAV